MRASGRLTAVVAIGIGAVACPMYGYGVEGNPGLRAVAKIGPTRIRLTIGPGCYAAGVPKKAWAVQIVSATDAEFQRGVSAASARLGKTEQDCEYPPGWQGPKFERYTIEIDLPPNKPMKDGHRYWVRVNSPWLMGKNTRAKWVDGEKDARQEVEQPRYGIREVFPVTPNMLQVVTGAGVDLGRLYERGAIVVTSPDDPDFRDGLVPRSVGRRSNLDFYIPRGWPWKYWQRHEVFLVLDKPVKQGKTYSIELNAKAGAPVTCGRSRATLKLDDRKTINLAIKVNQVGYLPDAPAKYGYVGMWAGELNAVDFAPFLKRFEIRDASTHAVVFEGAPTLRGKATYRLENGRLVPDPQKVKGPETVYKQDLSYEDVYELDLSPLKEPGEYYVAVPGLGRSFGFRIGPDQYGGPFRTLMNGLFHQRCGIEIKPPFSKHYRPACHRNRTEYSTFRRGIDKDPFKNLPKHATDGKKHDLWGGHHDAGDWNPRAHIEVAEHLFLAYELNRTAFADGRLNIPENQNGIPDLLDEAYWALDLWTRLQDGDGGVCAGIESNGDPMEGDSAATDRLREFAFAKDVGASYRFAAVAAHAAVIWRGLGKTERVGDLLDRARGAWDWAEKNGGESESDRHAYAAAMLWRATQEREFDEAFRKHSIYTRNPRALPNEYRKYDQTWASFYYGLLPNADPELKKRIVASFETQFAQWRRAAETTRYRYMRSPYAPNTWGTGGLPKWLVRPAMTMRLTKNAKIREDCRRWILLTNDFSLGCHPMNLVFTVGLGQRYVTTAFHHLQKDHPTGLIPGLQTEAAGGRFTAGQHPGRGGMGKWPGMSLFPPGPWPDLYKYSENASPGMNEGVTSNMAATAFAYAIFVRGE